MAHILEEKESTSFSSNEALVEETFKRVLIDASISRKKIKINKEDMITIPSPR